MNTLMFASHPVMRLNQQHNNGVFKSEHTKRFPQGQITYKVNGKMRKDVNLARDENDVNQLLRAGQVWRRELGAQPEGLVYRPVWSTESLMLTADWRGLALHFMREEVLTSDSGWTALKHTDTHTLVGHGSLIYGSCTVQSSILAVPYK